MARESAKPSWLRPSQSPQPAEPQGPARPCAVTGCPQAGLYPAPKSPRHLDERVYLCLDHVRAHNAQWNFYDGYSEDEIYAAQFDALLGERPTWPATAPVILEQRLREIMARWARGRQAHARAQADEAAATAAANQRAADSEAQAYYDALALLGLGPQATWDQVKAQFRALAKEYHPDRNPDNPRAEARFKLVAIAYKKLEKWYQER